MNLSVIFLILVVSLIDLSKSYNQRSRAEIRLKSIERYITKNLASFQHSGRSTSAGQLSSSSLDMLSKDDQVTIFQRVETRTKTKKPTHRPSKKPTRQPSSSSPTTASSISTEQPTSTSDPIAQPTAYPTATPFTGAPALSSAPSSPSGDSSAPPSEQSLLAQSSLTSSNELSVPSLSPTSVETSVKTSAMNSSSTLLGALIFSLLVFVAIGTYCAYLLTPSKKPTATADETR